VCVFCMSSDRVIIDAIKVAQNLLWQNLPPAHNLTDAATVMRFRELVRSQAIRSALERSSDTLLAFTLRAVEREISDQSRTNRETINRLWDVLDDPHLNQALGLPQSRMIRR
jgi:crotonobetainyl-CoA:carnitine CoA-transferase CaiB-like acyl-CoA transferase